METKGIIFNGNDETPYSERSYTVTVWGDAEQYLLTVGALLTFLGFPSPGDINYDDERYRVSELVKHMLPSWEQIKEIEQGQFAKSDELARQQTIQDLTNKIAELER